MKQTLLLLLVLLCSQLLGACSDSSDTTQSPSVETRQGWMEECVADDGCDPGAQCICGVCTLACASDNECDDAGPLTACVQASVGAASSFCGAGDVPVSGGVCLAPCTENSACGEVGGGLSCEDAHCAPEGGEECADADNDGFTDCDGDCNDADAAINPQSTELCDDGLDNNCDGQVDDSCSSQCVSSGDCSAGQVCVSGQCVVHNSEDTDGDGISDTEDNCRLAANPDQLDSDNDGLGDACDDSVSCSSNDTCGPGQICVEGSCTVDVCSDEEICDDGLDNDCNGEVDENCFATCASDSDCPEGAICIADECIWVDDTDTDGDGVFDVEDNCRLVANPDQLDSNDNGVGDACDTSVSCFSDDACGPGQICVEGLCVEDSCSEEICDDGLDNDCDGEVDEDCSSPITCNSSDACGPGQICVEGLCMEDSCSEEICDDGLDNDCDGEVDENCSSPVVCESSLDCAAGQSCVNGVCR